MLRFDCVGRCYCDQVDGNTTANRSSLPQHVHDLITTRSRLDRDSITATATRWRLDVLDANSTTTRPMRSRLDGDSIVKRPKCFLRRPQLDLYILAIFRGPSVCFLILNKSTSFVSTNIPRCQGGEGQSSQVKSRQGMLDHVHHQVRQRGRPALTGSQVLQERPHLQQRPHLPQQRPQVPQTRPRPRPRPRPLPGNPHLQGKVTVTAVLVLHLRQRKLKAKAKANQ